MLYSLQSELSNILIVYIPVLGFSFYSAQSTSQHGLISHNLFQIGLTGSIFLTVAIAIERYATVCHPFFKVQTYLFNAELVSRVPISLVRFPNPLHHIIYYYTYHIIQNLFIFNFSNFRILTLNSVPTQILLSNSTYLVWQFLVTKH